MCCVARPCDRLYAALHNGTYARSTAKLPDGDVPIIVAPSSGMLRRNRVVVLQICPYCKGKLL